MILIKGGWVGPERKIESLGFQMDSGARGWGSKARGPREEPEEVPPEVLLKFFQKLVLGILTCNLLLSESDRRRFK